MVSNEGKMIREFLRSNSNWNSSLDEIRMSLKNMKSAVRFPSDIRVSSVDTNGVSTYLFSPVCEESDKIIVYYHGGGYCLGIVDTNKSFVAKIAEGSGCITLMIDYRLSPENPYPAALEDAVEVYKWVLQKYKPENIVFVGDSSGCGLILASLFKARDLKLPMPAALVLISPVVDYSENGESLKSKAEVDPYQYTDPFEIAKNFLANNDVKNPFISPLYGNFHEIPPMLIHGSDYDVFLSDSVNLAKIAKNSGVDVSLKIWEGMWHIFHMNCDILPEGREALKEIYEYIDKI